MQEALIFDCDGTLADTMPAHFRAWQVTLAPLGLSFPEQRFYALAGVPTPRIAELVLAAGGPVVGLDAAELAARKEKAYRDNLTTVAPIEKVVSIARQARGLLPMAVASGSHRDLVQSTLQAVGIAGWFDVVVAAEDVVHPKPAPDVFLEAARRLGVPPAGCTVYEDGDLGIQAAQAAGMRVVDIRLIGDPQGVPEPPRDDTRPAKPGGSSRGLT
jgi:beta-phosphoglucomutase family hydrolase